MRAGMPSSACDARPTRAARGDTKGTRARGRFPPALGSLLVQVRLVDLDVGRSLEAREVCVEQLAANLVGEPARGLVHTRLVGVLGCDDLLHARDRVAAA